MEPDSAKPNEVEHYKDGVLEGVDDESETIRGQVTSTEAHDFSKHHVVPEVEQVEQQAQADNDTQHEHVLRSPLNLTSIHRCSYIVATVATSSTVLRCQDERINDVNHSQGSQT